MTTIKNKPKRIGRRGPRPEMWVTGPDPQLHEQHTAFGRARAQANFRGETWNLSFPEWVAVWGTEWHRRGRKRTDLMLCRIDIEGAWTLKNVRLMNRYDYQTRVLEWRLKKGHIATIPSRGIV